MATSGTNTFDMEVHEIVDIAYDLAGGEHITGYEAEKARTYLNLLLREIEIQGHPLASLEKFTQTVTSGTREYTLDSKYIGVLYLNVQRDSTDTKMNSLSLFEYEDIASKDTEGRPTQYTVDAQKDALNLKVWPTPDNSTDVLTGWALTKVEDVGTARNTLDVIQRYLPALVYGLAYKLSLKNPKMDINEKMMLKSEYEKNLKAALEFDEEKTSFFATPQVPNGYGR